ncbi:hypothetical protein GCM10007392_16350 [Saccharospirillum salsuginis]|uniref:Uncharacterized protein n=1 Tax=Saccharospirillum salsuginis TaxID=418750 RepID=A0A918K5R4_9GAMM|nr:hypothetical protein GCM10007392_16350 [Saccharospirillum salsuginis]
MDLHQPAWSMMDSPGEGEARLQLIDTSGRPCLGQVVEWEPEERDSKVRLTLKATGRWLQSDNSVLAHFQCRLSFYRDSTRVDVEYCLHNPKRSQHPGGLWDLGDPGSIHFQSTFLELQTGQQVERSLALGSSEETSPELPLSGTVTLHQASSGGQHWDSKNHVDASGCITPEFIGYRLSDNQGRVLKSGLRPDPVIFVRSESNKFQISMPLFWQNFPSALSVSEYVVQCHFFPPLATGAHELQGGERKTQSVAIDYGAELSTLTGTHYPLIPQYDTEWVSKTDAFPWFRPLKQDDSLQALLAQSLVGDNNFFRKREVIDEYGWRNFGDIFADHETLYQPEGDTPFISHYNNQYDAIYGFARQFLLTGDCHWFTLMDDLAHHVCDIDIYHTQEDRSEYNNGLFWHTDHYLDARTATHRTYSQHNNTSSIPGQTGGGPGTEHCYTTGLKYHYFLTGNPSSKSAVKELADWMIALHEGSDGLLAQLLSIKKIELNQLKQLFKGKAPHPYRYPFTRGTGNYINSLIDAFDVTQDSQYLRRAEYVIRNTVHPDDDIQGRGLENVEVAWSYVVFLTSLAHYLWLKERLDEEGAHYNYAKASLLNYCQWMRRHEAPFLMHPENLEYPNDTWAAQDIRKAMLMYLAAEYDQKDSGGFHRKGQEWLNYVCRHLEQSDTSYFARIQIILLQNFGPHLLQPNDNFKGRAIPTSQRSDQFGPPPKLTTTRIAAKIATKLFKGVLTFRPTRERAWLQARVDR